MDTVTSDKVDEDSLEIKISTLDEIIASVAPSLISTIEATTEPVTIEASSESATIEPETIEAIPEPATVETVINRYARPFTCDNYISSI